MLYWKNVGTGTPASLRDEGDPAISEVSLGPAESVATCSCGSGIPVQKLVIAGEAVTLVGLPLILQQFHEAGKSPEENTARELLETVKIYNPVPVEAEVFISGSFKPGLSGLLPG